MIASMLKGLPIDTPEYTVEDALIADERTDISDRTVLL
jgi:hypothetical protein